MPRRPNNARAKAKAHARRFGPAAVPTPVYRVFGKVRRRRGYHFEWRAEERARREAQRRRFFLTDGEKRVIAAADAKRQRRASRSLALVAAGAMLGA